MKGSKMKSLNTYLLLFFLIALALSSCAKMDVPKDTPACIKAKIKEIQSETVRNPPASVWQYEYNGQTVYYIPSYCCDFTSQLFDSECKLICSPDGGFSGSGDGKCPDFFSKRTNEKLIWKDERK